MKRLVIDKRSPTTTSISTTSFFKEIILNNINIHAEVSRTLADAINFYAAKSYEASDDSSRHKLMEAECRACLRYVLDHLDFPADRGVDRQHRENVSALLLIVSTDFVAAGFAFAGAAADMASKKLAQAVPETATGCCMSRG
jgi:hypothetical protein